MKLHLQINKKKELATSKRWNKKEKEKEKKINRMWMELDAICHS
jgi:hypothetical protein